MRKNVLEYLESSARMHADKPAFCDENRVFTFGELLKTAQGLGTHLAKTVDTLHKPVAVLIGRTAESVAAMQGVLYAGGCYVPIDDHMPEARIRRIFEQVRPVPDPFARCNLPYFLEKAVYLPDAAAQGDGACRRDRHQLGDQCVPLCGKLGCTEQVRAAHAAQSRSRR